MVASCRAASRSTSCGPQAGVLLGGQLAAVQHLDGGGRAHDVDLGAGPGEHVVGAEPLAAHGDEGPAEGLAQHDGEPRDGGGGVGVQQLGAATQHAVVLLADAGQVAGDVDEEQQRDAEAVAPLHEPAGLVAGVGVEAPGQGLRVVGDDADRPPAEPAQRGDGVAGPAGVQLEHGPGVEQGPHDRAHVVGAAVLAGHERPGIGSFGRQLGDRALVAQQRHEPARGVERLVVGAAGDVRDAAERPPCVAGPPSRSASTSSPVTRRTTSGPVTNSRPAGPCTTTSVSAGPYAAPPAAGPSTTDTCATRPLARVCAANTRATPSRAETPSRSRAPPECHTPTTGTPRTTARSVARGDRRGDDSSPSAPPCTVGSVANASTGVPRTVPCDHEHAVGVLEHLVLVEQRGQPLHHDGGGAQGGEGHRTNTSDTSWPPKPKLGRQRGLVRRTGAARRGRRRRRPRRPGRRGCARAATTPSRSATTVAIASTAPAAPSRWPVHDLVAVTGGSVVAEGEAERAGLRDVAERGAAWRAR